MRMRILTTATDPRVVVVDGVDGTFVFHRSSECPSIRAPRTAGGDLGYLATPRRSTARGKLGLRECRRCW